MPDQFVPVIEPDGVGALQPGHARHQVGVGCFEHQMIVVGHEAVRMYLPTGLEAGLRQGLQEILAVHVIEVNVSAAIPAAHHARPAEARASGEGGWYRAPLYSWRTGRGMVRLWRLQLTMSTEIRKIEA